MFDRFLARMYLVIESFRLERTGRLPFLLLRKGGASTSEGEEEQPRSSRVKGKREIRELEGGQ